LSLQLTGLCLLCRSPSLLLSRSDLCTSLCRQTRALRGGVWKWQDAGTRRQAFYTNLSSGRYRFLVNASSTLGAPGAGAEFRFVIEAAWYQTIWFQCLCALAVIGSLWCVYTLRLMQIAARFHELMGERLRERERIARELHDTLLQSVHALLLRLQTVVGLVPENLQVRGMIQTTIDHTDDVLAEARERVRDLRSHHDNEDDLVERLTKLVTEFRGSNDTDLSGFQVASFMVKQIQGGSIKPIFSFDI